VTNIEATLGDLGEFRLINEIILPKLSGFSVPTPLGDDCAFADIPMNSGHVVVTSDVTPRPLSWELGIESYYTWGWYSVLTSVSDLACTGADPIGFTTSIEAPSCMLVSDFEEFFGGVRDACKVMGIPNAGGNINQGPRFASHGTAIGTVPFGQKLTRLGIRPKDHIYVIGELGTFVSLYIKAKRTGIRSLSAREEEYFLRPCPPLDHMRLLRAGGVLSGASDNSDGLIGTLWALAERSQVGISLNLDSRMLSDIVLWAASAEGVDPWNLFFCWGDWQQVVAVKDEAVSVFEALTRKNQISPTRLGTVLEGHSVLCADISGDRKQVNLVRNENFAPYSYSEKPGSSLDYMLRSPLFD
jgi:thiamine-monophosphate kinase